METEDAVQTKDIYAKYMVDWLQVEHGQINKQNVCLLMKLNYQSNKMAQILTCLPNIKTWEKGSPEQNGYSPLHQQDCSTQKVIETQYLATTQSLNNTNSNKHYGTAWSVRKSGRWPRRGVAIGLHPFKASPISSRPITILQSPTEKET